MVLHSCETLNMRQVLLFYKCGNYLVVHAQISESFILLYSCNQVVTTTLPFSESLDDFSHGSIYCLLMSETGDSDILR